MQITDLDHVFISASNLETSRRFYCDVLGLEEMPRPSFDFPGYWLGANGKVQVHMGPDSGGGERRGAARPVVDHIAFAARDSESWVSHLRRLGITPKVRYMASRSTAQIFITDPDGLAIELNFSGVDEEPSWNIDPTAGPRGG